MRQHTILSFGKQCNAWRFSSKDCDQRKYSYWCFFLFNFELHLWLSEREWKKNRMRKNVQNAERTFVCIWMRYSFIFQWFVGARARLCVCRIKQCCWKQKYNKCNSLLKPFVANSLCAFCMTTQHRAYRVKPLLDCTSTTDANFSKQNKFNQLNNSNILASRQKKTKT